jgi:hypothetical protein
VANNSSYRSLYHALHADLADLGALPARDDVNAIIAVTRGAASSADTTRHRAP